MTIKRIYIEITNICNLKCAFCAGNHRTPEFMSLSTFETVISMVKPITDYIYLHVQGEPLLHPDFDEILTICDQYEMKVQLVTNGTKIADHSSLIEHPSLRKLSLSLQSADYQITRNTDEYLKDILSICEKASFQGHPICELRFWISDKPLPEASSYCLDELKKRYEFVGKRKKKNYRIMQNVYVDFAEEFQWPSVSQTKITNVGTCHGAIDQIAILSNGTVVPCCLDSEGLISFGNIKTTPLDQILKSERYTQMVRDFRSYKIGEQLCKHCTYRLRFNK